MFKRKKPLAKSFCCFMVMVMFFCYFGMMKTFASSVYVRPKKSVFLVMDDSGSMTTAGREHDANYALQTFLATLDRDDEVNVYFLHDEKTFGDIDISKKNQSLISNIKNNYPTSAGDTPYDVVTEAAKDLQNRAKTDSSYEYWLVVITDGGFNKGFSAQNFLDTFVKTKLKSGDYPHFMYIGIGDSLGIFKVTSGFEKYVCIDSDPDIIKAMNNATLDITNRQLIKTSNADGKSLKFTLPYPVRNIVILAQNKQTNINSADCKSDLKLDEKYDIEYPINNPGLQHSTVYYITEKNSSSIKSGDVCLHFNTDIKAGDAIIMVEPAIGINAKYIDEGGNEIDPSDMKIGQDIHIELDICDSETNDPIQLDDSFGTVDKSIIINETEYNGDKVDFTVDSKDVSVDMIAKFSDGFVLDVHDDYTDLEILETISLFISNSGSFECDIDQLKDAEGITVTPLINGNTFSEDAFKDTKLCVKGENFFTNRFEIDKDEANKTYIIHPKGGFFKVLTPKEEKTFEIEFTTASGNNITESINVLITGKRNVLSVILIILGIGILMYLVVCEITRKRFPRGSYVQYFMVNNDGTVAGKLTDRVFMNKASLKNINSYIPLPLRKYRFNGDKEYECEHLTFEPFNDQQIVVKGVGDGENRLYVPIDFDGEEQMVNAPVGIENNPDNLWLEPDTFVRDYDWSIIIRYSTKKYDKDNGIDPF